METMQKAMRKTKFSILWLLLIFILLTACSNEVTPVIEETPSLAIQESTPTAVEPSQTPIPAAAVVNGERISLAFFESEVDRYLIAQEPDGNPVDDESVARMVVLNDIIDQVLLAQGARESGAVIEDSEVQDRIDSLSAEVDLAAWMNQWGYTQETLFQSLKLQMLAAVQREEIVRSVPEIQEQAKLQQVFAYSREGAENALVSLRSGRAFDDVAYTYDPQTGGNLGWVPKGYLLVQAVEDAAFSLPIGSYSEIIESDVGYHIVLVLDREERPVSGDVRLVLQRQALYSWLVEKRATSTIEVLVN
jgi:hypothetical protein